MLITLMPNIYINPAHVVRVVPDEYKDSTRVCFVDGSSIRVTQTVAAVFALLTRGQAEADRMLRVRAAVCSVCAGQIHPYEAPQ